MGRGAPAPRGRRPALPRRALARPRRVLPPLRRRLAVDPGRLRDPRRLPDRAPGRDGLDAGEVHPGRRVDAARAHRLAPPRGRSPRHLVRPQLDPPRGRALGRRRDPRLRRGLTAVEEIDTPLWPLLAFGLSSRCSSTRASSRRSPAPSSAASTPPSRRVFRTGRS